MLKYRDVQSLRTRSTAIAILELLENIEVDDLISGLFLYTNDEASMELVKKYEKLIIRGKTNKNFLRENLNLFYRDMSRYLKRHNLFKVFVEFVYFIYSGLSDDNESIESRDILNIYQNILLQQFEYLVGEADVMYGVTTKGKIMTRKQRFPYSDYPVYEIERNRISDMDKITRVFKKYGYSDEMLENMEIFIKNDGLINNMTLIMTNFINENTEDIIPSSYMLPSNNSNICNIVILEKIEEIKEGLKKRKHMLPIEGILCKYRNAGDVNSLFMKELFQGDKMFLLYKLENKNNEGMYGVYDLKDEFFYSLYRDTSLETKTHLNIEKFVLKSYSMITTENERTKDIIEVSNLEDISEELLSKTTVEFMFKEKNKSEQGGFRHFDRRKYLESTVSINPYIRKLPVGATASPEAIANARKFGYKLDSDETFVTPFVRATFRKKD